MAPGGELWAQRGPLPPSQPARLQLLLRPALYSLQRLRAWRRERRPARPPDHTPKADGHFLCRIPDSGTTFRSSCLPSVGKYKQFCVNWCHVRSPSSCVCVCLASWTSASGCWRRCSRSASSRPPCGTCPLSCCPPGTASSWGTRRWWSSRWPWRRCPAGCWRKRRVSSRGGRAHVFVLHMSRTLFRRLQTEG